MIRFGFFDSVDGDRKYSADDISNFFETLIPNGVMAEPENTFQVCENSGLTVKVLPGWGFISRKWIHNDAELFLTLDQPDIILNRADRIVIRLNRTLRTMEIAVKRGTPGEKPSVPALQRDDTVYEISLAYIMIWGGRTEIYQNDIGDERGNSDVCGRILGFDKIGQILNRLSVLEDDCYHCNGVNDNITLPAYIYDWKQSHSGKVLKIVGNFGVSDDVAENDDIAYSMVYKNTDPTDTIIDFAHCTAITAKNRPFAYLQNCTVRNIQVVYPNLIQNADALQGLVTARDTVLENCCINGSLDGNLYGIACYRMTGGSLHHCKADFESDSTLWGIMATNETMISACDISVAGTAENPVYGIAAIDSYVSDSCFRAKGESAYGGHTEGNFTGCEFYGLGEVTGYGFFANGVLTAESCSFAGYTKDTENGIGIGIFAGNQARLLLHSIRCPERLEHDYTQTGSITALDGCYGYYDGVLYESPVLPETDTVLSYTDFRPIRTLTQAEYDTIVNPNANTLYVIVAE